VTGSALLFSMGHTTQQFISCHN